MEMRKKGERREGEREEEKERERGRMDEGKEGGIEKWERARQT